MVSSNMSETKTIKKNLEFLKAKGLKVRIADTREIRSEKYKCVGMILGDTDERESNR